MIERDDNYYYINGKRFDRVHNVLKVRYNKDLVEWQIRDSEAPRKLQEKQDIGTEVHDCIAKINNGKIYSDGEWDLLSDEIKNGVTSWLQAKRTLKFEVISTNLVVYSTKYMVADEIDEIHRESGDKLLISDNKTGKELWFDGRLQIGAYYLLGLESHRDLFKEITGGRLLRLDIDTGEWYESSDIVNMPKHELIESAKAFINLIGVMRYQEKYEVKNGQHSRNRRERRSKDY